MEPVADIPENPSQLEPPAEKTPPRASIAGAGGNNGNKEANNTGGGDDTAGGGLTGDTRDYAATLLTWLEQHKDYPRRARVRRQQGTVMLYFVIDRHGRVLEYRIEEGSGHPALDQEVLSLIQRAQPLPAMPVSMEKDTLELVVPVEFFLNQ